MSHLERARAALAQRNYTQALALYREHLREKPDDTDARREYRKNLRGIPAFREKKAELLRSPSREIKLRMALRGKDVPALLDRCEDLLAENPWDATVLLQLARLCRKAGDAATAIDVLDDLLALGARQSAVFRERALTLVDAGRHPEALETFGRYDTSEESAEIRRLIERELPALIAAAAYEDAAHSRDLERQPGQALEAQKAQQAPRTRDEVAERARQHLAIAQDESKDRRVRLRAWIDLAEVYRRHDRHDEAVEAREKAAEIDPTCDQAVALAEVRVERAEARVRERRKALEKAKGDPSLEKALADRVRERWQLVVDEYARLVEQYPGMLPDIHLRLGEGCYELGRLTSDQGLVLQSIAELQREYTKQTHRDRASILLGRAFIQIGMHHLARKHFTQIIDRIGELDTAERRDVLFEAFYELATVLETTGDLDGALGAYEEIFRRDVNWRDVADRVLSLNARIQAR